MSNYKSLFYILILLFYTQYVHSQSVIRGYIFSDKTDEKVPNAVLVINNSTNYFTDSSGYFEFKINNGNYKIYINALGFYSDSISIEIDENTNKVLFIRLLPAPIVLEDVTITGERFTKSVSSYTYELEPGELSKIPQVGEPDAFRSIQALPGITGMNDLSSLIFLRGGNFDETLLSLDNVPIYNPYHLGEMFSSINTDIIQLERIYTSNYPSNYGDYLSGILDIKTKNNNNFNSSVSLSLISSKLFASVPIYKGAFTIAARRTYFDFISSITGNSFPYYFYDIYGKFVYPFDENNLFETSVFYTKDSYLIFLDEEYNKSKDSDDPSWGNLLLNAKFTHYFNNKNHVSLQFYSSSSKINADAEANVIQIYSLDENNSDSTNSIFVNNRIIENSVLVSLNTKIQEHNILAGLEAKHFNTSNDWDIRENDLSSFLKYPFQEVFFDYAPNPYSSKTEFTKFSFYALDKLIITKDLEFIGGLRASYLSNIKEIFVSPYILSIYKLDDNKSLKLSFGSYYQYLYTIKDQQHEEMYAPFSSYFVVESKDQVSSSDHYAIGLEVKNLFTNYNLNIDAYYKSRENLTSTYKSEKDVVFEPGSVKGLEILLKKYIGDFYGWISYSLSRSIKSNKEYSYFTNYDRTHSIKILFNYNLTDSWTLSGFWTYSTGLPATPAIAKFLRGNNIQGNQNGYPTTIDNEGRILEIIDGRKNSIRLSDFSRLDLGITGNFLWSKVIIKPYLQVLNVYNSFNPYYYSASGYDTSLSDGEDRGSFIIPTIGVTVEF